MPSEDGLAGCHVPLYAEGKAIGVARTPFDLKVCPQSYTEGLYTEGRWQPSTLVSYTEGLRYADGQRVSTKGRLRRRATPRAAVGVLYAEGIRLYAEGFRPSAYSWIPVVEIVELLMGSSPYTKRIIFFIRYIRYFKIIYDP
jgi:hypothetical protein